jgi:hypothetical protein
MPAVTYYNIDLPRGLEEAFEGIALGDDGSVRILWKRWVRFDLSVDGCGLTMCALVARELTVHANPVERFGVEPPPTLPEGADENG